MNRPATQSNASPIIGGNRRRKAPDTTKPVARAYDVATRKDRYIERTINVVVVLLTLIVNAILALTQRSHAFGAYALIIYGALLYIFDLVLSRPNIARHTLGCHLRDSVSSHVHTPIVYNETLTYVGIWLVWWLASQLLHDAIGSAYDGGEAPPGWPVWLLLVLPTVVLATWGDGTAWYEVLAPDGGVAPLCTTWWHALQRTAVSVFGLVFLLSLAVPAQGWTPQRSAVPLTVVRVFIYFVAIFVVDWSLERRALSEESVTRAVDVAYRTAASIAMSERAVEEQTARSSLQFCSVVMQYEIARAAGRTRGRRIIALSAWVLVVPSIVLVVFTPILLGARIGLFFWRQRQLNAPPPPPPAGDTPQEVVDPATVLRERKITEARLLVKANRANMNRQADALVQTARAEVQVEVTEKMLRGAPPPPRNNFSANGGGGGGYQSSVRMPYPTTTTTNGHLNDRGTMPPLSQHGGRHANSSLCASPHLAHMPTLPQSRMRPPQPPPASALGTSTNVYL